MNLVDTTAGWSQPDLGYKWHFYPQARTDVDAGCRTWKYEVGVDPALAVVPPPDADVCKTCKKIVEKYCRQQALRARQLTLV